MKVAFVTTYDGQDIGNWSGTAYYMSKGFQNAGIDIEYIGNLKDLPENLLLSRFRRFIYNRLLKKFGRYLSFYEPENLKHLARQVEARLEQIEFDLIFSPGALPIAFLNSKKPIVLWTDATFAVMENYYACFTGLNRRTIRNSHLYEQNVFNRVSLAIFSSEWASSSAVRHYGIDPSIVKVIPYGANIECNRTAADIAEINRIKSRSVCKLLFIGQEWDRKGGDSAVKVTIELNRIGINTELIIVGCTPPEAASLPVYIKVQGFIDKSDPEGKSLFDKLYSESHFFILPTIAECTPIVFSEANSFGLPVLTTSTGGIGSIIIDNINGKMFGKEMDIALCTAYASDMFKDFNRYNELSIKSFNEYTTRLNWNVSIGKCIELLKELTRGKID